VAAPTPAVRGRRRAWTRGVGRRRGGRGRPCLARGVHERRAQQAEPRRVVWPCGGGGGFRGSVGWGAGREDASTSI
jgi:hypothetical protein